ncbi:hypothetical protein HHI36_005670, partial [Cryptolaemus montrouzieri]
IGQVLDIRTSLQNERIFQKQPLWGLRKVHRYMHILIILSKNGIHHPHSLTNGYYIQRHADGRALVNPGISLQNNVLSLREYLKTKDYPLVLRVLCTSLSSGSVQQLQILSPTVLETGTRTKSNSNADEKQFVEINRKKSISVRENVNDNTNATPAMECIRPEQLNAAQIEIQSKNEIQIKQNSFPLEVNSKNEMENEHKANNGT